MYRYRQTIQRLKSNAVKNEAFQDYCLPENCQKELKFKSKSIRDILIAKNRKLPKPFDICHSNSQDIERQRHKSVKSKERLGKKCQAQQNNKKTMKNEQYGFECLKTSFFGGQSQMNSENIAIRKVQQNIIRPQTYASDRAQAFEVRQKLKKSTSMKNLIEQTFLRDNLHYQNDKKIIQTINNEDTGKEYDSKKYNWRLSKSKDKILREKSLSSRSCKEKLLCELNKKVPNKNKLTLNNISNNINPSKLKVNDHRDLYKQKSPLNDTKPEKAKRLQKNSNEQQKLSYTFGSDVIHCLNLI